MNILKHMDKINKMRMQGVPLDTIYRFSEREFLKDIESNLVYRKSFSEIFNDSISFIFYLPYYIWSVIMYPVVLIIREIKS